MSSCRYYHAADVMMMWFLVGGIVTVVLLVVARAGGCPEGISNLASIVFLGMVGLAPVISLLFGRAEGKDPPIKWFKKGGRG